MSNPLFLSWQSDTPTKTGRNFIKSALEECCESIANDTEVAEALRNVEVDSDTQGEPGQPPIVETIYRKIDTAAVFVADMTFVGKRIGGRPTPNPNVLIEYGRALKSLTHKRVICVMNIAHGEPTETNLPFNLRHVLWPITFNLPDDATPALKSEERKKLVKTLARAIRTCLEEVPSPPPTEMPKFPNAIPHDTDAHFRKLGEAIGFKDDFPNRTPYDLIHVHGPAIWLRVLPVQDSGQRWTAGDIKELCLKHAGQIIPINNGHRGYSFLRAEDGAGIYGSIAEKDSATSGPHVEAESYTFIFETGEIWSADTALMSYEPNLILFGEIEKNFTRSLKGFSDFLQSLGITYPYKWIAGISGTKGRNLAYSTASNMGRIGDGPICASAEIVVEGEFNSDQTPREALQPFFAKIFERCGTKWPEYLPMK